MTPPPRVAAVATLALVAMAGGEAHAQRSNQGDRLRADAERLYEAGDFVKAADRWKKAHDAKPAAEDFFRMGLCYDKLADSDSAVAFFQRCLEDDACAAEYAAPAHTAIARIDKAREPAPPTSERQPPLGPRTTTSARRAPPSSGTSGSRTAAWVTFVGAGAMAATSIGTWLGAKSIHDTGVNEKDCGQPGVDCADDAARVRTFNLISQVTLGLAAASGVASAILFNRSSAASVDVAVTKTGLPVVVGSWRF